MVLHNLPASRHALKHQSKKSMRMFAGGHRQTPAAGNYGGTTAEQINRQVLKFQVPHFVSALLIILAVSLQSRLPTLGDIGAGNKRKIRRIPIALHETLN